MTIADYESHDSENNFLLIIDTHFVQQGRIGRFFQAVVENPKTLCIGLGEDTGLFIINGQQMEANWVGFGYSC